MVWGCFDWSGVCNLVKITGKMDSVMYKGILSDNLRLSAEKLELMDNFVFQHDNDPKHTSRLVRSFLNEEMIEILKWPAQSSDINLIGYLWEELDRQIPQIKRRSFQEYKEALLLPLTWPLGTNLFRKNKNISAEHPKSLESNN